MNIPNLITMCRFVMIPFFFWSYTANNFLVAAILFFAAGVSDMLDGMIARKFNLTSDLGKIIDPLADKLMQMCAVVMLALEFNQLIWLLVLLCAKEVAMIIGGFKLIKDKKEIMPSKWYGKVNTAIIFIFLSLLIWLGFGKEGHKGARLGGIPEIICYIVFSVVAFLIVYSFIRYYIEGYKGAYKRASAKAEKHAEKAEKHAEKAEKHAEQAEKLAQEAVKSAEQAVEKANSKAEKAAEQAEIAAKHAEMAQTPTKE